MQREQHAAVTGKPAAGQAGKRGVLTISAGDNFLPGPQLAASGADPAQPIYDATAFAAAGFDVSIFGNHDFDQTPDFLARWLTDVGSGTTFVSGNLGFDAEPALLAQVQDGTIVSTHVAKIKGEQVGIIGLTTPQLPQLTSSRGVTVDPDLATIANAQAAAYAKAGVDKVVLVSHLQDIRNEVALAGQLHGVDVIVGGGGHELLAGPGDAPVANGLSPAAPFLTPAGPYPLTPTDADGKVVPVVTTNALYTYVGRLVVTFDDAGEVLRGRRGLQAAAGPRRRPERQPADPTVAREVAPAAGAVLRQLPRPAGRRHLRGAAERRPQRRPQQGDQPRGPGRRLPAGRRPARGRGRRGDRPRRGDPERRRHPQRLRAARRAGHRAGHLRRAAVRQLRRRRAGDAGRHVHRRGGAGA